jgi:hypothetical protein
MWLWQQWEASDMVANVVDKIYVLLHLWPTD